MRRLLSFATALTLVPAAWTFPAAAQAAPVAAYRAADQVKVGPVHALDAAGKVVRQPLGAFRARVNLFSSQTLAKVEGWVYRDGRADPVANLGAFRLVHQSIPKYSQWESVEAADLPVGDYRIVVRARDVNGVTGETAVPVERRLLATFTEVKADRPDYTVEDPQVVVTGRVVHDGRPVAGLEVSNDRAPSVRATTDADGRFRLPYRFDGNEPNQIWTPGDARHTRATAVLNVPLRKLQTRVNVTVPRHPTVGDPITLTGKAERLSGTWGPLAGQQVTLRHHDPQAGKSSDFVTRTGPDGRYSVTVPAPAPGRWTAFAGGRGYASSNEQVPFTSIYRTRLDEFALAPRTVDPGAAVTAKGRLARKNADGTWTPLAERSVEVQYSTDGKRWTTRWWATTNAQGRFTTSFDVRSDARFRLHHKDAGHRDSFSAPLTVDVRNATAINGFNASPEPVRKGRTVTLAGALQRNTGTWKPFGGQPVSFYFLPKGSKKWTYLGKATADKYGRFRKGFKATKDGTWRAYYGGTAADARTYRDDYVDVR
ncbi:hypothetical protein ACFVH6_14170 [Spirillospora sp. NPDC127200]